MFRNPFSREYSIRELSGIVGPVARKYHIITVYLFGSRARGDNRKDSDYDPIVEIGPGFRAFGLFAFEDELKEILKRDVGAMTASVLRNDTDFARDVLRDRVLIYRSGDSCDECPECSHRSRFSTLPSNHSLYPRAMSYIPCPSPVAYSFHAIPISDSRSSRASSSVLPNANRSASSFPRTMPFSVLSTWNEIGLLNLKGPASDTAIVSDSAECCAVPSSSNRIFAGGGVPVLNTMRIVDLRSFGSCRMRVSSSTRISRLRASHSFRSIRSTRASPRSCGMRSRRCSNVHRVRCSRGSCTASRNPGIVALRVVRDPVLSHFECKVAVLALNAEESSPYVATNFTVEDFRCM